MSIAESKLPLISFVVINYNYGLYLRECVESILAQTYEPLECLIVDNASTDESRTILDGLKQEYPDIQLLFNEENIGQCAAFREAFRRTRGDYVVIVDADDYLLPAFAGTHLRAHLTVPGAVGFSSADMVQLCDDRVVLGTYFEATSARRKRAAIRPKPDYQIDVASLRPALRTSALEDSLFAAPIRIVHKTVIDWIWSPTSGSMYRRDALDLFVDNDKLEQLRFQLDSYFNYGINSLTGSLLIEKPLAIYRIHSRNNFTKSAALRDVLTFPKDKEHSGIAALFALEHIVTRFSRFYSLAPSAGSLFITMSTLARKAKGQRNSWFELPLAKIAETYFARVARRTRRKLPR